MMTAIDWTQIVGNFAAAAAGGGVAAFASWLAIGRQMRLQRMTLQRSAIEFHEFLLGEQAKTLRKIVNEKAARNMVLFADLDRLGVTYQLFERNRESLINVPQRQLREKIVDLLSDIQIWQTITRTAVSNHMNADRGANEPNVTEAEATRLRGEADQHWRNVNNWFPDVMTFIARCDAISGELRAQG